MNRCNRLTISSAPRITPQRTLLNHNPPSSASSGSSTKSVNGFSSTVRVKNDPHAVWRVGCVVDGGRFGDEGGPPWTTVGVTFRNDLNPTYSVSRTRMFVSMKGGIYLGHNLTNFSEVRTPTKIRFCEQVFYEPGANIITHLLEVFINFFVVFIILNELHDQCAIGKGEELCILLG
jgi:hypothetical protein